MTFRLHHRKPLPQLRAAAGARAWLQDMQRGEERYGERRSTEVDARAGDPGGGVVT